LKILFSALAREPHLPNLKRLVFINPYTIGTDTRTNQRDRQAQNYEQSRHSLGCSCHRTDLRPFASAYQRRARLSPAPALLHGGKRGTRLIAGLCFRVRIRGDSGYQS
jgi:hypothetical protein